MKAQQASAHFDSQFFHTPETFIHETAIVGPNVVLDYGAKIGPYAILTGTILVGARTQIHAHTMIGSTAQDATVRAPRGRVEIGNDTIIKEFTTISASKAADGLTRIGNHNFLMHFSHIGHDCLLEDNVIITNNTLLAGHVHVEKHAVLMAHVAVHQRCKIGAYSALAPYTGARQDIPPFGLFTQQPAHYTGLNRFNLKRHGFKQESINALKLLYRWFYRDKVPTADILQLCTTHNIAQDQAVQSAITFITNSARGISRQCI